VEDRRCARLVNRQAIAWHRKKDMPLLRAAAIATMLLLLPLLSASFGATGDRLAYQLQYDLKTPSIVHISVKFTTPGDAPLTFIMPRSVPGGYAQRPYDPFVTNVKAFAPGGDAVAVQREELGPRWAIGKRGDHVIRVDYDVEVARMEREIFAASDSSNIREGYVGLLGYSTFAFFDGAEDRAIDLEIGGPAGWPVFSTLAPQVPALTSGLSAHAADYYALADSQIMMGPKLQLRKIDGGVPLFLSVYAECDADTAQEAALARDALDKVIAYFGTTPFATYTVVLEFLRPVSARHEYNFSMEHLSSGTFYMDTEHALTAKSTDAEKESHRFNYAHHIAHSWIPKRAYGHGYFPFTWEITPVIDTIWFNEGFGRYVAIAAMADAMSKDKAARYRAEGLGRLRRITAAAPPLLQRMPLDELSREGSFLYSEDFRVGQNLFARGALMAADMDDLIRSQTAGQRSLRDALRHLIDWSQQNHRAFRTEELPIIFRDATGVDTADILTQWMRPPVH
jgi:predicted metalloprotease with PDZ domain